jgi:hypothetical protein
LFVSSRLVFFFFFFFDEKAEGVYKEKRREK